MKTRLFFLCAVLLLAACGSKRPPDPAAWNPYTADPPRDENFHGGPGEALKKYDANKDGTLTLQELTAGLHAEFSLADTGKNGCLPPDQVAAINQARIEADQSTATPLQDWNQDGCVSFQEFAATPAALFDDLDRNHDGKITPPEFDQASGRGGRGGRGEQGRGPEDGRGRGGRSGGPR